MNIYDKLLELQVIKNAFPQWASYRNDLTQYMIDHLPPHESIAIWGAGRCNDIDLKRLAAHFHTITLLDKDTAAMQEGIEQYGLEGSCAIRTEAIDFVGISPDHYRHYANTLVNEVRKKGMQTNCEDLREVALIQLDELYKATTKSKLNFGKDCYKHSVVVGVHSQLLSMLEWIWHIILQTIQQDEDCVRKKIAQMNTVYVERFNSALLEATSDSLIMGYELQRLHRPGTIQGAIQAAHDMNKRVTENEIEILHSKEIIWPFDKNQNITYLMQLQTMSKNKR